MSGQTSFRVAVCLWLVVVASGCSGPSTTVGGVVTLDGTPLRRATVLFFPAADDARTAHAITDDAGRYAAHVPTTTLTVTISLFVPGDDGVNGEADFKQAVPPIFCDPATSKLVVRPAAGRHTVADFMLETPRGE